MSQVDQITETGIIKKTIETLQKNVKLSVLDSSGNIVYLELRAWRYRSTFHMCGGLLLHTLITYNVIIFSNLKIVFTSDLISRPKIM